MPSPPLLNRTILSAIGLVASFGIALSLSIPLLALEMERWGLSSTISGLNAMVAGLGNVVIIPFVPKMAKRFGVRRVLATSLGIACLTIPLFWLWQNIALWFLLRFVFGAMVGVLFVLSEFWINASAPPEKRGLVMGIYATTLCAGFALGPAILSVTGTSGFLPYGVTAGIIALGFLPLAYVGEETPTTEGDAKRSILSFLLAAPSATLAALIFGAVETGAISHLAVHGVRLGFPEAQGALLISAFTLGNAVLQVPLGLLSDKMDRRVMLLALGAASTVFALLLAFFGTSFWMMVMILLPLGGISGALYTVGLAHLGSRFTGMDLASANAAFVMLYSVGLMAGPTALGYSMDKGGAYGLPLAIAALCGLYTLLVGLRHVFTQNKA